MEPLANGPRKQDRRTIYTINVIKDSFLELIQKTQYSKITIKKICEKADISRSTFYLHFDSINDVLNAVLDDAIMVTSPHYLEINDFSVDYLKENESLIPACQRVGASAKYRKLLLDPDLTEYIVGRIMVHERNRVVPAIQKKTGLGKEDAETLFLYTLHGSFAVNRANHFRKNDKWYHDVQLLNKFTLNGYRTLK
ncbi:TetR/AcrR family transcriptional regulator [Limosilactobacillus sp.]|uniref:TetR/AcrR family transcriptional regulator n=1 Tax=Limosilactobacillus sp. TaxID=2773925 RepID=UPI0035A1D4B3